jgi:heterodisulfide reductase subunit A
MTLSDNPSDNKPIGAVMVVGGGIAGMQAALDLADAGYFVHLVEKGRSIGGVMAQLDKTFPTNDCSTCMISPRLVEVAAHEAINVITMADVLNLSGEPGRFKVKLQKRPRYVDEDKCVGCGVCAEKCPKKVIDPFNEALGERRAIALDYPQAIPLVYTIDRDACIYFQKGKCRACEKFCENKAIDFDQQPVELELDVGAVLLAPGFKTFDPARKAELGFGRYPDVITALQFERMLAAAGPYGGHIKRVSDATEPKKVAWIQCVGSRDTSLGNDYCSYVCCMYATKHALIAKEHYPDIEPSIFYIDIRAQGKGFDRYYERAKNEQGVRYVRSMISRVIENPETKQLEVQYFDEAGELQTEAFDLVVLSVGLEAHADGVELAKGLDVDLDDFGFAARREINPLVTNREGVYVCGVFGGPKDIPETVTQASGAAGQAGEFLAAARGSLIPEKTFPQARDVSAEEPRIGVFVCHCGINIAGVVDVSGVAEYARTLPGVVHAEDIMFACSTDNQEKIQQAVREHNLNRVIVASCSPRTHEPLFQENLQQVGLNKYLFEMANIRDQCSWVHANDSEAATAKARDLIRMSVSRSHLLKPLEQFPVPVTQSALVIGGGVAGMTAALSLADQGFPVALVERGEALGGTANRLGYTLEGFDVQAHLDDLKARIDGHDKVRVFRNATVKKIDGVVGNFKTDLLVGGQAPARIEHGAIIVATGAREYAPTEYAYPDSDDVVTQLELHEKLAAGDSSGTDQVVMIQCVGCRNADHPYCSRICCSQAVGNALKIKQLNPGAEVVVLYRDIRTYGTKEVFYKQAREAGVRFIRYEVGAEPKVTTDNGLRVEVVDQGLRMPLVLEPTKVVLSAAVRPQEDARQVASDLKLPLDADGFFMEAHLKLRPLDFASAGYFLCGLAHGPKPIEESIAQAKGAAAKAATLLSKKEMMVGGEVAVVDRGKCAVCLTCVRACPFGVPKIVGSAAYIDPAGCRGCGVCAGACPGKAIQIAHHTDDQIMHKADALFDEPAPGEGYEPRVVAFICTYCTYTAADMAGSMRLQYPANVRVVKLLCTGRVDTRHLLEAFEAGADAVMVSGCELGDCHFLEGNYRAVKRVEETKHILEEAGVEPERLEMFHVGASDAPGWADAVNEMVKRARDLGPSPLRKKEPGQEAQAASA